MKTTVDDRLRAQAARFAFRFACDDCAHVARRHGPDVQGHSDEATPLRCSLGYPVVLRRTALQGHELELCKAFELA